MTSLLGRPWLTQLYILPPVGEAPKQPNVHPPSASLLLGLALINQRIPLI